MGYIFSYQDAKTYEQLLKDSRNGFVTDLQHWLLVDGLDPIKGQSVLGIGCGTGTSLIPLLEMGLDVSGLDPSPYMLDIAESIAMYTNNMHMVYKLYSCIFAIETQDTFKIIFFHCTFKTISLHLYPS